ncbi:MAG: MFS transporter, partial [Treponema sp.]|nr:MFS transporter [Treponema sp.]
GAAAVQPLVSAFAHPQAADPLLDKRGFSMMGLILGALMAAVTLITFFGTRERARAPEDFPREKFFSTYKAVFSNRPYVLLLITYALHLMGITFLQSILVYYTEYIYHRGDLTTPAMILLLVSAMVFIPISVLVSKKIGKKQTYQICFAIITSAGMIIFFLGHVLGPNFFLGLMVYAGIGVGFSYVSPFAMVPDTIDFDAQKTGERKEGAYYGMWTFTAKAGQALAVFLSGFILNLGNYLPGEALQPEGALLAIRLIIGPLPALILIAALILIQFYPLDEQNYKKIMDQKK